MRLLIGLTIGIVIGVLGTLLYAMTLEAGSRSDRRWR